MLNVEMVREELKNPHTHINYENIIQRVVESVRSREEAGAPSKDEMGSALEAARAKGPEEIQRVVEELLSRSPHPIAEIEYSVRNKVFNFLRSREEKIRKG